MKKMNINPVEIEFGKLYFGSTFYDPKTNDTWVKVDEDGAVMENDSDDNIGSFLYNEIVVVQ